MSAQEENGGTRSWRKIELKQHAISRRLEAEYHGRWTERAKRRLADFVDYLFSSRGMEARREIERVIAEELRHSVELPPEGQHLFMHQNRIRYGDVARYYLFGDQFCYVVLPNGTVVTMITPDQNQLETLEGITGTSFERRLSTEILARFGIEVEELTGEGPCSGTIPHVTEEAS